MNIFQHIKSGNRYLVIGIGRSVDAPEKKLVVYKQLYISVLKNSNIQLPVGSIWTRDLNDFEKKFKRC
jgi:hypothetical protein